MTFAEDYTDDGIQWRHKSGLKVAKLESRLPLLHCTFSYLNAFTGMCSGVKYSERHSMQFVERRGDVIPVNPRNNTVTSFHVPFFFLFLFHFLLPASNRTMGLLVLVDRRAVVGSGPEAASVTAGLLLLAVPGMTGIRRLMNRRFRRRMRPAGVFNR